MEKDKKSPFDKADSSAAIRERRLAEKQDRATLAQIEKNVHKKRFEGRSRLVAALHVRRLYQQAREAEHDRGSIIVAINKKAGGSNFRIDKWMMPPTANIACKQHSAAPWWVPRTRRLDTARRR